MIQFGLANAGWGGWSAFFAHPSLQALAWVTVALVALYVPSGGGMSTGEKEDRSNRWVQAVFSVIALWRTFRRTPTAWVLDSGRGAEEHDWPATWM